MFTNIKGGEEVKDKYSQMDKISATIKTFAPGVSMDKCIRIRDRLIPEIKRAFPRREQLGEINNEVWEILSGIFYKNLNEILRLGE